jgi:hypothetical protein
MWHEAKVRRKVKSGKRNPVTSELDRQRAVSQCLDTQASTKRFIYKYGAVIGLLAATAIWLMDRFHLPTWQQWVLLGASAIVFALLLRRHITSRSQNT